MASECFFLSQCLTVMLCRNTMVLSSCMVVLAQHAQLNALDNGVDEALQLMVVWGAKWKLKKQEVIDFDFVTSHFCSPFKEAPMA